MAILKKYQDFHSLKADVPDEKMAVSEKNKHPKQTWAGFLRDLQKAKEVLQPSHPDNGKKLPK